MGHARGERHRGRRQPHPSLRPDRPRRSPRRPRLPRPVPGRRGGQGHRCRRRRGHPPRGGGRGGDVGMTTDTAPPPRKEDRLVTKEEQPYVEIGKKRYTGIKLLIILAFWLICYALLKGQNTKYLPFQETTGFQRWLNDVRDWVQLEGQDNWFVGGVLGSIG